MKIQIRSTALIAGFLIIGSSQAYEELGKIKEDLAATEAPALPEVGTKLVSIRNGKELTYTVTAQDQASYSMEGSNGCKFTDPVFPNNLMNVTPSTSWENCGKSSGHAKVKIKGSFFPLKKGNKVVFNVQGETTEGSWTGTWKDRRVCKVKGTYRVNTASGEHNTWKIKCSGNSDKRTYYYSPALGTTVASERRHQNKKTRNYVSEYLRTE